MLSIIVCSRDKTLPKEFVDNIINTVGVDHEIITVDNSENRYTIFSAYNAGYDRSNYPYLCFVHEDVQFHTQNWGKKIISHLNDPETGIIGLAGGDLVTRIPASWSTVISSTVKIIQSDRKGRKETRVVHQPENYDQSRHSAILLDGVFLCMRRELMTEIKFDEELTGFHGYDFDISIQSVVAGYNNYVIYDVDLEHFSRGKTDYIYYKNLIAIFKKWEKQLPLIGRSVSAEHRAKVPEIEKRKLYRLVKKMTRKGFTTKEIVFETTYYAHLIGSMKETRHLKTRVFLIRLFNCPKYLLR